MKKPKKLSQKSRLIFLHHAGRKVRKGGGRKYKNTGGKHYHSNKNRNAMRKTKIVLPTHFDIHENTEETLKKLNEFRDIIDSPEGKIRNLDFKKMTKLEPSTALVLAAEIDVWNRRVGNTLKSRVSTWDPKVKSLLGQMGFFELLNPQTRPHTHSGDVTYLKFMTGIVADGSKAKELRKKIEGTIGQSLSIEMKLHLFEGLTEALTNTKKHAYHEDINQENSNTFMGPKNWWMAAAYSRSEKTITVSIYDRGRGIPATIYRYKGFHLMKAMSEGWLDDHGKLIEKTVRFSFDDSGDHRSSSRELHRGKGMKQLLSFARGGHLRIISLNGYCKFKLEGKNLTTEDVKGLKSPLSWHSNRVENQTRRVDAVMTTLKIAVEFNDTPAGRHLSDGPYSGEKFREEFLVPALKTATKENPLVIDLNDAEGYGSSFLDEAFGGLIRDGHIRKEDLDGKLRIEANIYYEIYKELISDYINRAVPENA